LRLEVEGVSSFYGDAQALWDVTFAVPEGKVVSLIGANGAGKSTVLRTVSGLIRPSAGRVRFGELDLSRIAASKIIGAGIAHVPEGRRLFGNMSVFDNLMVGAYGTAAWPKRLEIVEEVFGLFPRLAERRKQAAGSMSGGEQQMAAIGRALMAKPRVLMLDEPSLGLAPKIVTLIFEALATIRASGTSLLVVEQNARLALDFADLAYVMAHGRVVASGPAAELKSDGDLRSAYLGM
jgi:branched-chain amino acid transport system ATP-binding protein